MHEITTSRTEGGANGLGPAIHFAAGDAASADLYTRSPLSVGHFLSIRWRDGERPAAAAVLEAVLRAAPRGSEIHLRVDAEVHPRIEERLDVARAHGFALWQEKEGFAWTDPGGTLPTPEHTVVRRRAEVGRDAYGTAMASAALDSLDVVQADAVRAMGARAWANSFMDAYGGPPYDVTWLAAEDTGGDLVGFVAVGRYDERGTATIFHIGVGAAYRGHGYIDDLMRIAAREARERGFRAMVSDVDVRNVPMMEAMRRHGHRPDLTARHIWYLRRST